MALIGIIAKHIDAKSTTDDRGKELSPREDIIGRFDDLARNVDRVVRICAWRSSNFGREPFPSRRELMAACGMRHYRGYMAPGVDIALAYRTAVDPDVADEDFCRCSPR